MSSLVFSSFASGVYALLDHLADALRVRGAPLHSVRVYIFGTCAAHLHAAITRCSGELELEIETTLVSEDTLHDAKKEAGIVLVRLPNEEDPELLELNLASNRTSGPLHAGFAGRATPLPVALDSPLLVFLPSREDLALSMLGRFSEDDVADIRALMNQRATSWELLTALTADVEKHDPTGPRASLTARLQDARQRRRLQLAK